MTQSPCGCGRAGCDRCAAGRQQNPPADRQQPAAPRDRQITREADR